jgi:hypothetical protein
MSFTPFRRHPRRVGGPVRLNVESLEPRLMLYATLPNGMPILNSYPAAPAAVFLDFDGHAGREYGEPYSLDADPLTFNAEEQAVIYESWRRTALYFSMFNVNVTTIQPAASVPKAWLTMSPTYPGNGVATLNTFPSTGPTGYVPDNNFIGRTPAHEAGHIFGSGHIGSYDNEGNEIDEYANPPGPYGHIMGGGGALGKWTVWHRSNSGPATVLDTMALIAGDLDNYGGDGFRPDDVGGTIATAAPLPVIGNTQTRTGILERLTDSDAFSFVSTGGTYNIAVLQDAPAAPDTKVSIYNANGVLLAAEDGDPRNSLTNSYNSHMTLNLAAGTYYVIVASRGNQGDQGQYIVRVDPMADGWADEDVGFSGTPGYSSYDAATGTFTVAGSGHNIWNDDDSFHYLFQTLSGNGSITARVTGISNSQDWAQGGVMIRESLANDSKHAGLNLTQNNGVEWYWRTATGGNTAGFYPNEGTPFAPTWIRITRTGNTFRAFTSADGMSWTQFGSSINVSMSAKVYIGLAAGEESAESTENQQLNAVTFTNVALTGLLNSQATQLPSPADLTGDVDGSGTVNAADFVLWRKNDGSQSGYDAWRSQFGLTSFAAPSLLPLSATYNSVNVNWTDVNGELAYGVERSSDGINFKEVAIVGANVTHYTDANLSDFSQYFYRVRAKNALGVSSPSVVQRVTTQAGTVSNLNFISWTSTDIVLDWTDAGGESGYQVQRSDNGVNGWATRGAVAKNIPIFTDSGLTPSTTYYYRVQTLQGAAVTATSAIVSGSTKAAGAGAVADISPDGHALAFAPTLSRVVREAGSYLRNKSVPVVSSASRPLPNGSALQAGPMEDGLLLAAVFHPAKSRELPVIDAWDWVSDDSGNGSDVSVRERAVAEWTECGYQFAMLRTVVPTML